MRLWAVPVALALAGAVLLLVAGGSTVAVLIAITLMGSAAVLVVSLVFYEVGRSEDREREAERLRRDERRR
jgi:ABC-type transport system involved in cytochrome bd biosynthesis fused ATPase/permease subunit